MFNSSTSTLKLLASLVWFCGAIVLSYKSSRMLLEAQSINSNQTWIWLAILAGIMIGLVQGKVPVQTRMHQKPEKDRRTENT